MNKTNTPSQSSLTLSDKAQQILTTTQHLIQEHGYNGFSFRDVAEQVGIKSASVHYHFPTKNGLVQAATHEYRKTFGNLLANIKQQTAVSIEQLALYAALFQNTLDEQRVCLCGMLASDTDSLPDDVKSEINLFFAEQIRWLEDVFEQGQKDGSLPSQPSASALAFSYLSTLEGAMIIAKSQNKPDRLQQAAKQFIDLLKLRSS